MIFANGAFFFLKCFQIKKIIKKKNMINVTNENVDFSFSHSKASILSHKVLMT